MADIGEWRAEERLPQSKNRIRNCCKRQQTDNPSFHLDDERIKHRAEHQIKLQEQDRKFFSSLINQSFLVFCNYWVYYPHSGTSSISHKVKLGPRNQLRNKFKRLQTYFKFRFRAVQLIFLVLFLSCVNFVPANANNNVFSLFSSADLPHPSFAGFSKTAKQTILLTTASNSSRKPTNNTARELNTSDFLPLSSLHFVANLLPSTDLFNFNFYLTYPYYHSTDRSTRRLPSIRSSLKANSVISRFTRSAGRNQTKSAHFKPIHNNNAFPNEFNQPKKASKARPEKWPSESLKSANFYTTIHKSDETEKLEKAMYSSWPSNASTASAKFTKKYYSPESSSAYSITKYLSDSQPINLAANLSASIVNFSKSAALINYNDTFNDVAINANSSIDLNSADTGFFGKFLQPFTNASWWTAVPFPKSGYHNYAIVFLAFFITIVMLIVVIGNLLVCIAICTDKSLKTIQNWFIASLAVSDLLLGLIIMPFSLAYELMGTWVFSDLWCDFHHALDVLLTTASINNLCLISLDRFWSVTQAIEYLKKRTPCRAIFMIIFAWVFSALVSIPPLIGWKPETQIPGECQLSNDLGYVLYSSLGSFYLPSVVMVFVYAKIFIAARSRARKHVRKKQVLGSSSVQEKKKSSSQVSSVITQRPPASTSSPDNTIPRLKQPVTTSALAPESQQIEGPSAHSSGLSKPESKGSIQTDRAPFSRFRRKAQFINSDKIGVEESSEIDANQSISQTVHQQQTKQEQTATTEFRAGVETGEEHQTELTNVDAKSSHFFWKRSISTFNYDYLLTEDRKSGEIDANEKSPNESVSGRPSTPLSKEVTFSSNNIVFDQKVSGTQSISLVPQIVIHGSMQQLHLQANVKRAKFSANNFKMSDSNVNTNQANEKRLLTGTLSAGQLDCIILEKHEGLCDTLKDNSQPKKSNIKILRHQNEWETNGTAAHQQTAGSPQSILKATSDDKSSSPTALKKNEKVQLIELQEKTYTGLREPNKQVESILSTPSGKLNGKSKETSNQVSTVSGNFSEQTAGGLKMIQDDKLNHLGIISMQAAASISGSITSINYDYDSGTYMDEKSSKHSFEEDEFDFDDENESSNTYDGNASKRSLKSNLRQFKKRNFFNRWSFCRKWLFLNEKCASNQEEEFSGYEEEDGEKDEELDQIRSNIKCGEERHLAKKCGVKRILRKNRNKGYNASIISANNTSSSGTQSGAGLERNSAEKKSGSLFSRFSRKISNKSASSGSAKRISARKPQRSAKSTSLVSTINHPDQSAQHPKHKQKPDGHLQTHLSSTMESGVAGQYRFQASEADRQKRKVAKAREKRATLILGLIMGAFILGYIPFSSMYLIQGICPTCQIRSALTVTYWIGYTASAINPVIYTVFNRDFRKAFKKIVFR